MKEIIEQIFRIDTVAFENEQKNKSILFNEKLRFENEIEQYRKQKLEIANNNAKINYNQVINKAKNEYQVQEEKIKKISSEIEKNYLKVEKDVINEIFRKLFL